MKPTLDILWQKVKAMNAARKLQAKEYKRRLRLLNGEAKKLRRMQQTYPDKISFVRLQEDVKVVESTYIKREVFDNIVGPLLKRVETIEDARTLELGARNWKQYIPWIIAAIAVAVAYFKNKT